LGGLLNGPVQEVFAAVNDMVEPLAPVLDLLTSDIPLVSDLSKLVGGSSVTFLDAIRLFSGEDYASAVTFIETVDQVADTIRTLSGISASGKISLGGLSGDATKLLGGSGDSSAFTTTVPVANAIKEILASPTDAAAPESVKNAYADVTKGSLTFPIITSPGEQLFKFLFGGDATLVSWRLPSLNAGFELSQSCSPRSSAACVSRPTSRSATTPSASGRRCRARASTPPSSSTAYTLTTTSRPALTRPN
jgi:hypothetical protein